MRSALTPSILKALLLGLCLLGARISRAQQAAPDPITIHAPWNALLHQYVGANGRVDYRGLMAERRTLEGYLRQLSKATPEVQATWSADEQAAFWINAYNAATVEIITRYYPIVSMKDIRIKSWLSSPKSPWEKSLLTVGGRSYSLNDIENQMLRQRYRDPRVHFALVCASVSCPNLLAEAYDGHRLDQQLDGQARRFINDPSKNQLTPGQVALSNVFDWYAADFGGTEAAVLAYVNRYASTPLPVGTKIGHLPYNWNLNEQGSFETAAPMARQR